MVVTKIRQILSSAQIRPILLKEMSLDGEARCLEYRLCSLYLRMFGPSLVKV
jgi:hypothetical protein